MVALARYAGLLFVGVMITLSLFYLMHRLVDGPALEPVALEPPPGIRFGEVDLDLDWETTIRTPPEPPERPKEPPPPPQIEMEIAQQTKPVRDPLNLDSVNMGTGLTISTATLDGGTRRDRGPQRLVAIQPSYPRSAAAAGIEGWVDVELVVSVQGTVREVTVLRAQPRQVFDDAAIGTLKRWRFEPAIVDGEPVEQRIVQRLEFRLND